MSRILKIALIGTGKLSTQRIYPYLSSAGMKVQAVAARHRAHAEEKCALYGGRPYTNWRKMIEQEAPDAVIACVGPDLHYEASRWCLARRMPIYTEKPPASNAAQIDELLDLARDHRTLCMTGFKKRYSACYRRAKQYFLADIGSGPPHGMVRTPYLPGWWRLRLQHGNAQRVGGLRRPCARPPVTYRESGNLLLYDAPV